MRAERERNHLKQRFELMEETAGNTVIRVTGHLFDSGFINKTLDIIEDCGGQFYIVEMDVRPNSETEFKSSADIQISVANGRDGLKEIMTKLDALADVALNLLMSALSPAKNCVVWFCEVALNCSAALSDAWSDNNTCCCCCWLIIRDCCSFVKFAISMLKKLLALFTAICCLAFKLAMSICASVAALARAVVCSLLKF